MCSMDAPYAPKALAYVFAKAVAEGVADLKDLESQVEDVEESFARRDYGAAVIATVQVCRIYAQCYKSLLLPSMPRFLYF